MRIPSLTECLLGVFIVIAVAWLVTGCTGNVKPDEVVQVRTVTNEVKVVVPVPCMDRADVPALPAATEIDVPTAKTDQKAAATAADAEQYERYAKQAAKLIEQCVKTGGGK